MTKQNKGTHRDRVQVWIKPTERSEYFTVILKPGFAFEPNRDEKQAVHTGKFYSARAAKKAVIASLPCNCDRCAMRGKVKGARDGN